MHRFHLRQVSLLIILKKKRGLSYKIPIHDTEYVSYTFLCVFTKYCHSELFEREMKSFGTFGGKTWRQRPVGRPRCKRKIFKSVLKDYIVRVWAADHWWVLVNTVMNLLVGYKSGHLQEPEHVSLWMTAPFNKTSGATKLYLTNIND
jgi:hypothetical protein